MCAASPLLSLPFLVQLFMLFCFIFFAILSSGCVDCWPSAVGVTLCDSFGPRLAEECDIVVPWQRTSAEPLQRERTSHESVSWGTVMFEKWHWNGERKSKRQRPLSTVAVRCSHGCVYTCPHVCGTLANCFHRTLRWRMPA